MKAIVIAGGSISEPAFYKPFAQEADCIICADSGYLNAKKMGIAELLSARNVNRKRPYCG